MKRPIPILAALLAGQLLLAGGLAAAKVVRRPGVAGGLLLTFDKAAADRVVIEGPGGARTELVKADGAWKVASRGGFPAAAGKVPDLLDRLAELKRAEPVATSAEAAARFKVADAAFERRVVVEARGAPVATLLLGTAASMRAVHARVAGSSDVQLAALSTWDVPAAPDDWIDRLALRIPRGEIEAVVAGGVTLERDPPAGASPPAAPGEPSPGSWRAAGLPRGATLDVKAAEALVQAVADLAVAGIADAPATPAADALAITVRRAGGRAVEYRLSRPTSGADWTLRTSARPETFRVPVYTAEALRRAADPGTLSGKPPVPAGGAAVAGPEKAPKR